MCSIKYSNRRHLIIQLAHSMLRFDAHSPCCVVILMTLSLLLVLIHCWVISASPFEISKQIYWIIHVYSEQEREPCTNERTKYFLKNRFWLCLLRYSMNFNAFSYHLRQLFTHSICLSEVTCPNNFIAMSIQFLCPTMLHFHVVSNLHHFQFSPINGKCTKQILNKYLTYRIEISRIIWTI